MRGPRRGAADRSPQGGAGGFTLLETLVALAVLATVLASAFGVFSTGLRGLSRSDERLTLALFAESLLDRGGLDIVQGGGETSGATADGLLRWRVTKVPFELSRAEVDAAVAAAGPLLPREDATDRFGDRDPDAGDDDDDAEEGSASSSFSSSRAGGGGSSFGLGEESDGSGSGGEGEDDPLAREARSPTGATRPVLRLWQIAVVVESARGESFTLTTLQADRAP